MKKSHYELGKDGEVRAHEYLESHGYRIIVNNYISPYGEIDVIAEKKKTICFVEIKTRSSKAYGEPREAVENRKQRKIIQTAEHYIQAIKPRAKAFRFDVVELMYDMQAKKFDSITIIENAFIKEEGINC